MAKIIKRNIMHGAGKIGKRDPKSKKRLYSEEPERPLFNSILQNLLSNDKRDNNTRDEEKTEDPVAGYHFIGGSDMEIVSHQKNKHDHTEGHLKDERPDEEQFEPHSLQVLYSVRNNAPLGFESQQSEFLTGFTLLISSFLTILPIYNPTKRRRTIGQAMV